MPTDKTDLLSSLRTLYVRTQERQRRADVSIPSQFNVFRLVRRTEDELSHSNFLGSLLDPAAAHGQGYVFLRLFLHALSRKEEGLREIAERTEAANWVVTREKSTAWGRLDIVIHSEKAQVIFAIENKINAIEGDQQVRRYRRWIDAQNRFKVQRLIYLTLEGEESKSGLEDFQLSYRRDIYQWLTAALGSVLAPRIRDAISQYLDSLPLENMPMTQTDELAKELAKPANVELAVAVAERVPRIKVNLFSALCAAVEAELRSHLQGRVDWGRYELSADSYGEKWAGLWLIPALADDQSYAYWRIEKVTAAGDGLLYYGIATNGPAKALMASPLYAELVKQIEDRGFDAKNAYWVRRKATEYDTQKSEFWKKIAVNPAPIAADLASQLLELFEATRELIVRLNDWATLKLPKLK